MSDKLKHKVVSGLLWRSLERFGTQAAGFVVSIVLARLLEPKDFGTITLITVFIAVASCFVDGGFATARSFEDYKGGLLGPIWLLGSAFLLRLESMEYFRINVIQAISRNPQPGQI